MLSPPSTTQCSGDHANKFRCALHRSPGGCDQVAQVVVLKHTSPSAADTQLSGRGKGPRVRGKRRATPCVRPRLRAGTTFTWETQHPCMSGRPSSGLPHKQPANKAVRGLEVAYPVSVHLGQEFSLCHFGVQDDRFASVWRQKPRTEFSWPPMQPKGHPARRGQAARHINGFHNI